MSAFSVLISETIFDKIKYGMTNRVVIYVTNNGRFNIPKIRCNRVS